MAFFCLLVTLAVYLVSKRLHLWRPAIWTMPALMVPAVLVALLLSLRIPFTVYNQYSHWLVWLLGPATVAFALPIYQQRTILRRYPVSIGVGVVSCLVLGAGGSWAISHLFSLSPDLERCMVLRSVSTPFALEAAGLTGASQGVTSLVVILTGLWGIIIGETVLFFTSPRSRLARGAMWGAAAHAFGTAKAQNRHTDEGVVSSIVMILAGVAMVLLSACGV
jgi:putative effector of murein hydrolase